MRHQSNSLFPLHEVEPQTTLPQSLLHIDSSTTCTCKRQNPSHCSAHLFRCQCLEQAELFKGNSSLIPIHHHSIMSCCSYWHILSNPIPQYDCITNKTRKATTKFKDCTEDAQGKKNTHHQTNNERTQSGNTDFYFALKAASFNRAKLQ